MKLIDYLSQKADIKKDWPGLLIAFVLGAGIMAVIYFLWIKGEPILIDPRWPAL